MISGVSGSELSVRGRLERDAGEVLGSDLKAHLARDAVLVVGPGRELIECAAAIAEDDAVAVAAWLADGTLRRPTDDERAAWPVDAARRWLAVVVRPFVLVQDVHS